MSRKPAPVWTPGTLVTVLSNEEGRVLWGAWTFFRNGADVGSEDEHHQKGQYRDVVLWNILRPFEEDARQWTSMVVLS